MAKFKGDLKFLNKDKVDALLALDGQIEGSVFCVAAGSFIEEASFGFYQALSSQDHLKIARHAHSLKSSAAMLGALELSKSYLELEHAALALDFEGCGKALSQIEIQKKHVVEEFRMICQTQTISA